MVQGGPGVVDGGYRQLIPRDVRTCFRSCLVELVVGPLGPVVGGGELAACSLSVSESDVVERLLDGGAFTPGSVSVSFEAGEPLALPAGRRVDAGELAFGGGDGAVKPLAFGRQLRLASLGNRKVT